MKKILLILLFALGVSSWGWGQVSLPHLDPINYTVGQGLQTQTGWTSLNSGDDLLIASGSLTYAGLPSSTGNKVTFDGSGIDAAKLFTQQTTGTVYYSFLLNITSLGSLNTTGGYFTGFNEGTSTNYGATVWSRLDGAGFDIGINPRTTATNTVWSSGTTTINTTLFIVISYQMVSGTANDIVKLWINPIPGIVEPTATLTATNTGTDLVNVNRILIRQDGSSATPFIAMDEFRIGTTWADVTPASSIPTITVSTTSLTGFTYVQGSGPSAEQNFTISGSNLTADISIASPTDYEISTGTGGSFVPANPITLTQSGGSVGNTTIYVRLKAGLSAGNYNGEDITASSAGAESKTVTCSGTVTAPPTPLINISPTSLTGFTYIVGGGPSSEQNFTISGSNLTADISIASPTDYEISTGTGGSFVPANPITLTQSGGSVGNTTIYVRLKAGLSAGNYNGENITASSSGADNKTVTCSGTVVEQIDWANLQWPPNGNINLGGNFDVYAQVYEPGVTPGGGQGAGITAWIGYNTSDTDPSGWAPANWVPASYFGESGNNDEYKADIGVAITTAGTYYYASRFQLGSAPYVYGGYSSSKGGGFWNGTTYVSGVLTVNPPPQIDWANLQWPPNGTINMGGIFDVYAQVYEPGVTDAAGQGAGITAWIGYNTIDNNPSGWTNWVAASYNTDVSNNDEYMANIATGLPAGTYYYASRFKMGLADYVYGGYSSGGGGFWDGTTYVSGVLTVNTAEPANHVTGFAATANYFSAITVSWTDSDAAGYLVKGSNVSFADITQPADGTAEPDGGLVKNVTASVQLFQFTGLSPSTQYYFKIFPYNGTGVNINYKTDGIIPQDDETTPIIPFMIINELDSDTPGTDALEFVELYDGGTGNTNLSGLVVVFYNGSNDLSYATFDLDNYSTNANGFFVLGNAAVSGVDLIFAGNTLQNGQDAVALFSANGIDFPINTPITTANLLDALVYDTDDADDPGLLVLLNVGQPQINENGRTIGDQLSNQRLPNGSGGQRNTITYDQAYPTPDAPNVNLTLTWTGTTSTNWSISTNWSPNSLPDERTNVSILNVTNDPILNTTANCRDMSLATSSKLDIAALGRLTVSGTLTNNGTLTIKSDATGTGSLIHNTVGVTGTVERYLTQTYYHYIASPVAAQTISPEFIDVGQTVASQAGIDFYRWVETTNTWDNIKDDETNWDPSFTSFEMCRGYAFANANATTTKNFTGELNVGDKTISLTATPAEGRGWNLIGSPFAATVAINSGAQATNNLVDANSGIYDVGYAALYLWKEQVDYLGVARTGEYVVINNSSPAQYVNPGQAFMVKAAANGSYAFNANMRKQGTSEFYKSTEEGDINRFWLTVVGPEGDYNEALIGFVPGATNGLDEGYDAIKLKGNPNIALYSKLVNGDAGDFAIQALPPPSGGEVVPISIDANKPGTYVFRAGNADNMENITVRLEDRQNNIFTTLEGTAEYAFTVTSGVTISNRFFLHFKSSVGIDDPEASRKVIYSSGSNIFFEATGKTVVEIFSITGQKISGYEMNATGLQTISVNAPAGWYIVRLITAGNVRSEKVFIN